MCPSNLSPVSKLDNIKTRLYGLNHMGFDIEEISPSIIKFSTEGRPTKDKFIVLEKVDVYRNIDDLVSLLKEFEHLPKNPSVMRIPFFAGVSGHDLGNFLLPDTQISMDLILDVPISFEVYPADFNIAGSNRFAVYLNMKKNQTPVYRSNDNFMDYEKYFLQEIENNEGRLNTIIPFEYSYLFPNNLAIQSLFKKFEETKG